MSGALNPRDVSIRRRRLLGGQDNCDALSHLHFRAKLRSKQMVLMIIQPARSLRRKKTIAIPDMPRLARSLNALQIKRERAIERHNSHAVFDGLNAHLPIARMRRSVKVSVVHQRFQLDLPPTAPPP